jgi:hypothetical protein
MRFSSSRRPAILRAGALLTFLATWSFAPSTGLAACGDYVNSRAQREGHGEMFLLTEWLGKQTSPGQTSRDRVPCSGPTCSERRSEPDWPIPPGSVVRAEHWCDTTCIPYFAAADIVVDLANQPLIWPPQITSTLSRPPRACTCI